jgi:anti-sigma regulatory factor (Ser/Thr protein kinase)/anti-anti-sigma regulatory factor
MSMKYELTGEGAVVVSRPVGSLALADVAAMHVHLLKGLAEQPSALLVDLSELRVEEPLALAVFSAASRQANRWPGIPVLLCGARPEVRDLLSGPAYRRLPGFDSVGAARDHVSAETRLAPPVLSDELLPVSGAARRARDVATDACLRWDLADMIGPASLIVSELVSNVVDHVHTMMTLRLALRPRYLQIAVRDGSPVEPVRPGHAGSGRGRGLMLIEATAHSWGWLPSADGKVVWASLRRPWP